MTEETSDSSKAMDLLVEYAKVVLSLVALLLGFSIGFLSSENAGIWAFALYASWALLLLTAITCLLLFSCLVALYRNGGSVNGAILFANLSFFSLAAALVCLSIFGLSASQGFFLEQQPNAEIQALTDAIDRLILIIR